MNISRIVGIEAISSAGKDKFANFKNCLEKKTFIDSEGLSRIPETTWADLRKDTPPALRESKSSLLAYKGLISALQQSRWTADEIKKCGFIFASTTSQIDLWEEDLPNYKSHVSDNEKLDRAVFHQSLGYPLVLLTKHFGISGPQSVVASSCSAGLQAVALADLWIRTGIVDRCIVGSTEILSDLTSVGFNSLRLVVRANSKPFAKNRNGINLGEGAGFLLIESNHLEKKTEPWGYISGAHFNMDSYHATAPHPEGKGSAQTMQTALKMAHLEPEMIPWIYAHGTGSVANDSSESLAINSVFAKSSPLPVTSTKSIHGHTLAASGLIESVIGLVAMKENCILPTLTDSEIDPKLNVEILSSQKQTSVPHFLKNSLGFGGINASVIFSKECNL